MTVLSNISNFLQVGRCIKFIYQSYIAFNSANFIVNCNNASLTTLFQHFVCFFLYVTLLPSLIQKYKYLTAPLNACNMCKFLAMVFHLYETLPVTGKCIRFRGAAFHDELFLVEILTKTNQCDKGGNNEVGQCTSAKNDLNLQIGLLLCNAIRDTLWSVRTG